MQLKTYMVWIPQDTQKLHKMLPLVPRERNTTSTTLPRNNPGIRRRLCTSEQSTALDLTTQQHEADKRPFLHRNGERQMLMDWRYNSQYKSIPRPRRETGRREGSILTRKKCVSSSDLSLADYGDFFYPNLLCDARIWGSSFSRRFCDNFGDREENSK